MLNNSTSEIPFSAGQSPTQDPIEVFIQARLLAQKQWLEAAASRAKAMHFRLSSVQLTAIALVPVVNTLPPGQGWASPTIVTSALAAIAAIATGLLNLGKYQETWIRSRRSSTALESLLMHFRTELPPFDGPDRFTHLVQDCEAILAGDLEQWSSTTRSSANSKSPAPSKKSPRSGQPRN